jgi:MHS family proline/betaine transporter-like MFS transporter
MNTTRAVVDKAHTVSQRRMLAGGCVGQFVELFDFSVYALAAPVLSVHFFPKSNPTAALLGTFAVYALAFFARPLGGIVFGFLGDRIGRLRVLMLTVLLMGAGTAMTGLLPSYASIGIAAPILLVLCRLAQGLSMGGETSGAYSFIVESAPEGERGKWIGMTLAFVYLPTTLAALFIFAVHALVGESAYNDWGWRIAFVAGGVIAVVGFWIRRALEDPEEYKEAAAEQGGIREQVRAMMGARKSMLRVILINVPMTIGAYMLTGYMFTFVTKVGGVAERTALLANAVAVLFIAALTPLLGALSDRVGRKPLLWSGAAWLTVAAYPAFMLAASGSVIGAFVGQILLAIGIAIFASAYFVTSVEVFPTAVRCSSHGLATNLEIAIFGGTAPLISAALVNGFGTQAPAYYMMLLIVTLGVWGILITPETRGVSLRTSVDGLHAEGQPKAAVHVE